MRNYVFWLFILLLFIVSCATEPHDKNCRAHVYGHAVETYYSEEIVFSTKPVAGASIFYNNEIVAMTNQKGEYDFCLPHYGYFTFISQKMGYLPKSATLYINNKASHIDFYLEKPEERHHGWGAFPATSNGPDLEVTADGLSLYSRGDNYIYATQTVTLENGRHYKFIADVKKDVISREISFGIIPQIKDASAQIMTRTINGWQKCLIEDFLYDTTKLDSTLVEEGVYSYTYPDSVDVVLKIGVEGIDLPIGYFNFIKIIKEQK